MQNRWERQAEVIQQITFYIKSTKWRVHLHTQVEIACISCIWLMYQNAVLYELLHVAKPSLWHQAGISRAPGTASVGMKATRPPDGLSSDEGPTHTPRSADCESVAKMSLGSNTTSNGTTTKTRMQPQPQVRIQIDQQAISNQKQHHNRLSDKRPRPTTATTTKTRPHSGPKEWQPNARSCFFLSTQCRSNLATCCAAHISLEATNNQRKKQTASQKQWTMASTWYGTSSVSGWPKV